MLPFSRALIAASAHPLTWHTCPHTLTAVIMRYSTTVTVGYRRGAGMALPRQQRWILQEIPAWGMFIIPDVSSAIWQLLPAFMLI